MTGLDGLLPGEHLAAALSGCEIEPPTWPLSVTMYRVLQDWNETQARCGQPTIEAPALLAELLEVSLLQEGWSLSDLQDGSVRAFVASGLDMAVAALSTEADL
jgi:hypothetical protein